jgi:mannose-6-phosphate isomerase-like protein (cupin superfamily)
MSAVDPIVVSVPVNVPAEVAFDIFVDEVDRWWRPGPHFWNDPARAIGIRFQRGAGGRWIELYDDLGDDVFVMGEITGWNPGVSLALTYRSTALGDHAFPLDLWFAQGDDGTTVTLRHDGWNQFGDDAVAQRDRYARGWAQVLGWFANWAEWGSPRRLRAPVDGRAAYALAPGAGIDGDTAVKASRRSTLGSLSITDSRTMGGAPLHLHRHDDEAFYVLAGTIKVSFGGETHILPPGGFAFVPRGIPHEWDTIGEAHVLIVTAPGGLEEFLAALHTWPGGYADAWRVLGERHGYTLL